MRILVVDDNLEILTHLKSRLEERCCAVDAVSDGEQALYQAKIHEYDAIVLDFDLPHKNGFDICTSIRQCGKHTPIILISVTAAISHKITGFRLGIDDYITKPFHFEEVYARIHNILRRPAIQNTGIFTIDNLVLDTNRQRVVRGEQSIYLTRKEFSLLEYLIRNAGKVLSRGDIIEHVWDMDIDPFSNTIETHIRNLRRKIEFHPHGKLIFSVPGRGYKIDTFR